MLPVGKEYFLACAIGCSWREAAVTSFLAEHGSDASAILGQNDKRDTEAEVLEIEASAEEIGLHAVFKEEIFDLLLDICGTLAGIILDALSVAYFGVPLLAGGQCLVGFNLLEHVIGHEVIGTPRNVTGVVIQLNGRNLTILFEERGGIGNEYRPGLKLWYIDHGIIQKIHILQILLQRYGLLRGREKTLV